MLHNSAECRSCQRAFLKKDGSFNIYKNFGAGAQIRQSISKVCFKRLNKIEKGWQIDYALMEAFER